MNISPVKDESDSIIASKDNVIGKPQEIKESYISQPVGITAFKNDAPQEEIMSPFRKKKGTLKPLTTKADD